MTYLPGLMTSVQATPANSAAAAAALVRQDNSVYFQAFSMDPTAFAASSANFFDKLKKQASAKEGYNQYQYLQALVRQSGLSKGTGPIGQTDPKDLAAIKNVFQSAYLDGVEWQTWLERYAQSPYASAEGGPKFSKEVSTALQYIDKTDAENILSKSYYEAFGVMPSDAQIGKFKSKFNTEAQRQMAETTTTRTSSGTGTASTSAKSKTVTSGMGFTTAEQQQFIADYLKTNYKITGKEETGTAATIIKDIKRAYADNLLPEPPMEEILAFAADAVGTGDAAMYKQKVDGKIQSIRNTAAGFYPSLKEGLATGSDVASTADALAAAFNQYLGTSITRGDDRIKAMINYNDGKTVRVMNADEQLRYIKSQAEYKTSDKGRAEGMQIANALENGLR